MSTPLDPVRIAFDKAVGPYQKRHNWIAVLKEEDVGKERRAEIVKELVELDQEWLEALIGFRKAINECSVFQ